MPECPRCGLINPPEARRCDCGHDLAVPGPRRQAILQGRSLMRTAGYALVVVPLVLLLIGIVSLGGLAAGFFVLWAGRWIAAATVAGIILIVLDGLRKPPAQ